MKDARILVVDDEPDMLDVCREALGRLPDTRVETAAAPAAALERLRAEPFDLIISDLRLGGASGVDFLRAARELDPSVPCILITGFPTVETAIAGLQLGAYDYIVKPFAPDQLRNAAARALDQKRLRDENRFLSRQVSREYRSGELLGASPAMRRLAETLAAVAATDADVLVLGETGTGKELVARAIHEQSARARRRFVPVDCGAIPDALLEAELFGHERGAYTDARTSSPGLLEFADQGTVFLDEVCEFQLPLQAKLLRALQERQVRRLGGRELIRVNVRLVAATNRVPEEEVAAKRFRQDLYYLLCAITVRVPPLRERGDDIPLLLGHYLRRYAAEWGRAPKTVGADAAALLLAYPWPGNVRELQNLAKQLVAFAPGELVAVEDLPEEVTERGLRVEPGFFAERERRLAAMEA
ncbi:MAG: sigma-54-dependent Fis family transcriptional regulator, partial [Planctomycetes bacterium]|nr:sigma-54-dependent Fis family transcriptional regulator [Planctomycetota bacterium]